MRSRFESGFSSSDKVKIETLYLKICGKRVRNTGCNDCYRDAYIETTLKLKTLGKMPKKPNYVLKAGAIIHPQGTSKFYSLNISDEVAENWLGQYPAEISKFETYPTDWESRVKARMEGTVVEPTKDELKDEIEKLNAEIEAKEAEIEQLKANAGEGSAEAQEIEALKNDLSLANETIEASKKEHQEEVSGLNKTIADLKLQLADANATNESQKAEIQRLAELVAAAKKAEKKAEKKSEEAPKAEETEQK